MYETAVGLGDSWLNILVATLITILGFLGRDRLRAMDSRHQRAEDKFKDLDQEIAELRERLGKIEAQCEIRYPRDRWNRQE